MILTFLVVANIFPGLMLDKSIPCDALIEGNYLKVFIGCLFKYYVPLSRPLIQHIAAIQSSLAFRGMSLNFIALGSTTMSHSNIIMGVEMG